MASIQGVYLALFGRPADPLGLAFFNSATNNGANLTAIGDLSASAEYQTRFTGQSSTQIITSIYRSLFNRDPDLAGLTFFATALASGTLNINNIAIAIFDGAQGSDLTIRDLKVAAANAFTAQIDTVTEINNYSGTAAANSGAAFIATVTTTAPTEAQVTAAVAAATSQVSTNLFTLTDKVDNFPGTGSADTFSGVNGSINTLTAADAIDGGAGVDSLNLLLDANASVFATTAVKNIEQFFLRDLANGTTVDFGTIAGETQAWNDRSTGAMVLDNLGTGTVVGVKGDGSTSVAATTFSMATATDAVSIAIDGGVKGGAAIANTSNGATGATITSTVGANTVGAITLSAGATVTATKIVATSDLTTGNITGHKADATMSIEGAGKASIGTLEANVDVVDASKNTGGVTLVLDAETDTKFTGGTGSDKVTTGAALGTGSVDAGAGSDTLTVAASAHLASATLGGKYTNFETLGVLDGVSVDLDFISGITAVEMTDGGAATALIDLSAAQAGAVTIKAGDDAATIGVKGATTVGQIDTVKMTFNDGDTTLNEDINVAASAFTLTGIENIEVTAVDQVEIAQSAALSASLVSVKLAGAGNISFTTGNIATANFALDASASTGTNVLNAGTFATNGIAITGGTGVDTITGSGQADVINGGAGNDIINAGAGIDTVNGGDGNDVITLNVASQSDTMTGGAGIDTFKFSAADIVDTLKVSAGTTAITKITDFVAGTDKIGIVDTGGAATSIVLSSAQTIASAADLTAVYAGITAIAASADGGALSGAVVTVSAGAAAGTYLYINDAAGAGVSNANDMLINITGITGTLTASDFVFA